jgi:hypothetical protein
VPATEAGQLRVAEGTSVATVLSDVQGELKGIGIASPNIEETKSLTNSGNAVVKCNELLVAYFLWLPSDKSTVLAYQLFSQGFAAPSEYDRLTGAVRSALAKSGSVQIERQSFSQLSSFDMWRINIMTSWDYSKPCRLSRA